ncbi:unnamed protein product [Staurois parvus]|uniref:Uncharacterized protein n=1 Tax=Staurois parvus TaxID=386267 RepID=A0ABN9CGQ3_9NEOB|nr:unnamed protein product [Staurois parvus]
MQLSKYCSLGNHHVSTAPVTVCFTPLQQTVYIALGDVAYHSWLSCCCS